MNIYIYLFYFKTERERVEISYFDLKNKIVAGLKKKKKKKKKRKLITPLAQICDPEFSCLRRITFTTTFALPNDACS